MQWLGRYNSNLKCQKVSDRSVGSNTNFFGGCLCWIEKKCNGFKGPLHPGPNFRCTRCLRTAQPNDGRTVKEVKVDDEKIKALCRGRALCSRWLRAGSGYKLQICFGQVLPGTTRRSLIAYDQIEDRIRK